MENQEKDLQEQNTVDSEAIAEAQEPIARDEDVSGLAEPEVLGGEDVSDPAEPEVLGGEDASDSIEPVASNAEGDGAAVNAEQDAPQKQALGFKTVSMLFDTLEIFLISVIAVLLVFTFGVRLCRVSGDSMNNTLLNGELLVTSDLFYEPELGDVVVFHLSNSSYKEPLVKRVIATEGQTVTVNISTGETYVDGVLIDESYAHFNKNGGYNQGDISSLFDMRYVDRNALGQYIFTATVPEGKIFVMGDNRNNSSDSRNRFVGFVDEDCILGKALFRISPFTNLS